MRLSYPRNLWYNNKKPLAAYSFTVVYLTTETR